MNQAIHIALVGCGGMAHWHCQQLQLIAECSVVALVDPVAERTRAFREKYFKDASEYDSLQTLLAVPPKRLDAVVLVTPHAEHFPQARLALERGWHVLVEKPMVTRPEHALELGRLVRMSGKVLGISFQAPYTPEFLYLMRERDAGALGKFQVINGWLSQEWLSMTRGTWRQDPAISGGGQLYDSGAHLFNAILMLAGSRPRQVACFVGKLDSPVDINGAAIMHFENGAMASVAIGGNCPPFRTELQIQTDKCLITTDQYGGKLSIDAGWGKKIYPHIVWDERPAGTSPHRNFISAILGTEPIRCGVQEGIMLAELMEAMYESASSGNVVRLRHE